MTSKVTTEVLEKGTKQTRTILQIPQKQKSKIYYNKKAESEFFVDNSALAGFTGERILYMSVRELIENSLDSCEINHILPVIHLSLKLLDPLNDLWTISCKDNGIGIPSDKVPVAVCSFLTSGKYVEKQQRGLFGVGLKMIAAFSTKDTDHPLKVWSKSEEESEYYFDLRTDIGTNKPITLFKKSVKNDESQIEGESGFKVEAILRAKLSPVTKNKIYDYISQTSIVNPYAVIIFETDEGKVTFKRRTQIMPNPSREVLPHPSDMDLKTLKKAIFNFMNQKTTLQGILSNSFQKMSNDKAKDIINRAGLTVKPADQYDEHELIKVVNICKHTKFQSPNTDHLSPIGEKILTVGMTSEYSIILNKETSTSGSQTHLSAKILKPSLTAYSSRICVVNNRPTIVECGIAYGGDIPSFKLYRFANKIPLLYDEGSDVAREVISEVGINKMGISKKEVKEQFSNVETRSDRTVEYLPIHIFFHICSTKIPYKTAGKESIASEGDLKKYMKSCLSDLYRKVSAQIRRELKIKEDENKLRLYKHYIPFIVNAISESIKIDSKKLSKAFQNLAEKYVSGELSNIAKQIFPDSDQKRVEPGNKKNTVNNDNGNENKLSKFDTRSSASVSKQSNKIKPAKINIPRKITKK
ncbi:MAG: DNA topoisomerase VI subunit B [Nitrososphaeraceae archaeon]|nr:DNA topoisomerase VI subunit B [Nitrososphaeraceae archaeon]MDW0139601.1 DNA topoisomerase VI subunit B [Nitrososphaeraceae archaeon]MDW0143965.1 DNA topoisomerase VI subunit B [Nitrososphaeraceae archaeon]MDW0146189.1 DNA topoisomerase VI subunit B [Nitrososphaeraceae archaeon]MDW0147758.1 DNA topoisomerase VI subunit B [Nitrososphaeraceae archaeon]